MDRLVDPQKLGIPAALGERVTEARAIELLKDRAEAAEADAAALDARVDRLTAELAELAALRDGQGWRPFNPLPPVGEWIQIQSTFLARRDDDDTYHIPDTSTWEGWRPAPPQE